MKRYEFQIEIIEPEYLDQLIVCLARQGYAPYLGYDGALVVEISDDEITEIKGV